VILAEQNGVYFIEAFFAYSRAYGKKEHANEKDAHAAHGRNNYRNAASEKRHYFPSRAKARADYRAHNKHGYRKNPAHTYVYVPQDFFILSHARDCFALLAMTGNRMYYVIASELCERGNLLHGTSTATVTF
jgi:hypothetical protein